MNEYEFLLADRIAKIKAINKQYDLEHNAYISFSGGKDSTVLHYLIDMALPNNKIPRVFINTGIEYLDIVKFVKELAKKDDRIIIYNSGINIKEMLTENGYPFKSKEHCKIWELYKKNSSSDWLKIYLDFEKQSMFKCPKILRYQFTEEFNLKISYKCCYKLKKEPLTKWQKENNKSIFITGMLREEGGHRTNLSCVVTKNEKVVKFHPLAVVSSEWEKQFIKANNIKLCRLYYQPFNFKRTGCKGCPFSLDLQEQLDVMERLLPNEKKQCENIWAPVYAEYRRLGYRLRKKGEYKQTDIFDFID